MTAIVRHKTTNTLYRHVKDNIYKNLSTNTEGEVPPEIAQKIFAINLDATVLCNENSNIERLIKELKLKITSNELQSL
jgi:Na+-transporting NADH:ubiquinone oxidoreductase subunit NqrF